MPRSKEDTEKIKDRVEMKALDKEVLDAEYRKGAKFGFMIGAAVLVFSLLLGFDE
jgi:hypothetical protein